MLNSLFAWVSQGADVTSAAVSHSPQTVAAAVLCYALMNLVN
ncbi:MULTISPECIES: YshB family small membrane protein [Yersiniaceae]|uniref:YshB family small membrane protein n=1 Tax=Nissabacter archeti TaxID=1917880 RepID=A0ABS5JMT9_9GAMM|nr:MULTISPECIES: YshB family small membrane protein [Yersiniaceae]MBS0971199.1 YshB family small membrane protein [Nissabacter archeti]MDV5141842.1 YshB family small membrane protein [Chimaeribacter arupi]WKZ92338.1 YshB family small membrane protein [Chimaeribacter arupi]